MLPAGKVFAYAVASGQPEPMSNDERPPLETLGDRVWWAWNCLPRERGKPPAWKKLEAEHKISAATFSKLVDGSRSTVDLDTLTKLATALNVSEDWLRKKPNAGPDPMPTGSLQGRKEDNRYAGLDPFATVRKYAAIGGYDPKSPNPFQVAALYHGTTVDADIIEAVANDARGREGTRTAIGWGRELLERQNARNAAKPKKKPRAKPEPKKKPSAPPLRTVARRTG